MGKIFYTALLSLWLSLGGLAINQIHAQTKPLIKTIDQEKKKYKVVGKITDQDGNILPYANVIVGQKGTTSNEKGIFELNLTKGKYEILVRYMGRNLQEIEIDVVGNINLNDIVLQDKVLELQSIKTEGVRIKPSNINRREISFNPEQGGAMATYNSVTRSLGNFSSAINNIDISQSVPYVRGMLPQDLHMFLNGVEGLFNIPMLYHQSGFSSLSINSTQIALTYIAPSTKFYGKGPILEANTIKPQEGDPFFDVNLSAKELGLSTQKQFKNIGFRLGVRNFYLSKLLELYYKDLAKGNQFPQYKIYNGDFFAFDRITISYEKTEGDALIKHLPVAEFNPLKDFGFWGEGFLQSVFNSERLSYKYDDKIGSTRIAVAYGYNLFYNSLIGKGTIGESKDKHIEFGNEGKLIDFSAELEFLIASGITFSTGYQKHKHKAIINSFSNWDIFRLISKTFPNIISYDEENETRNSAWFEVNIGQKVGKGNLFYTWGGRWDKSALYGSEHYGGLIRLSYTINDAKISFGFRNSPDFAYNLFVSRTGIPLNTKNLDPETSNQFSLSFDYKKDNWVFYFNPFMYKIKRNGWKNPEDVLLGLTNEINKGIEASVGYNKDDFNALLSLFLSDSDQYYAEWGGEIPRTSEIGSSSLLRMHWHGVMALARLRRQPGYIENGELKKGERYLNLDVGYQSKLPILNRNVMLGIYLGSLEALRSKIDLDRSPFQPNAFFKVGF